MPNIGALRVRLLLYFTFGVLHFSVNPSIEQNAVHDESLIIRSFKMDIPNRKTPNIKFRM